MNNSIKSVYIDTCAITHMGDNGFKRLLAASKAGNINIFISEMVIWEKSKARHKLDEASLFYSKDNGIPLNAASFKKTLQEFGVSIIEHNDRIIKGAEEFIDNDSAGFDRNNFNDLRDAHILAAAFCELDISTIIASNDTRFIARIPILLPKFISINKAKINDFVYAEGIKKPSSNPVDHNSLTEEEIKSPFSSHLLSVLPLVDPESYEKYNNDLKLDFNKLSRKNIASTPVSISTEFEQLETVLSKIEKVDNEIKKRVLGYIKWFSDPPINKNDLYQLVGLEQYSKEKIENNIQRLKLEHILTETENYWFVNTSNAEAVGICDQAIAVIMPDILEIMELN